MKRNRGGYYIKEGVMSIFNHGFMSFASVCIIIACLIIMGSFSLLAVNVNNLIRTLEDENQIVAFVDDSLTDGEAKALQSQLEKIPNVSSATFVSREEARSSFSDLYDSDLFSTVDATVFRHRYIIMLDDISGMEDTQMKLLDVAGVAKVNAHLDITRGFITAKNVISIISIVLVAILFVVSLFIMSNTIKLTTFERREEIAIMKMVGATSSFIRWPFVVEGLLLGLTGSLAAYIAQWALYRVLTQALVRGYGLNFLEIVPFSVIAFPMLIVFLLLGFGVGVIGSLMAIKNYLKV